MSDESIDSFQSRHIGPDRVEREAMLRALRAASLDTLIEQTMPADIRLRASIDLPPAETEAQYLTRLRKVASKNRVARSYIGMGYYDCVTPAVILRNVFENPGWYTPYTPYQAEIAQGRLESLLNFQTMVRDLTGMDIATASLLDEGTAAGEAMAMFHRVNLKKAPPGQKKQFPRLGSRVSPDDRRRARAGGALEHRAAGG
jgi:glycine dehydrogenase